ncbi:hypothetical protein HUT06_08155 [Actinomadura sp. NAK00032]|nr:hypothetical protein HUT06_08155 [Actinomadura sp. NAK00032]
MKAVDTFTPIKAASRCLLFSAVNPKKLMICAAVGIAIVRGALGIGGQAVSVAVFVVIAVCSVAVPVLVSLALLVTQSGPGRRLGSSRGERLAARPCWRDGLRVGVGGVMQPGDPGPVGRATSRGGRPPLTLVGPPGRTGECGYAARRSGAANSPGWWSTPVGPRPVGRAASRCRGLPAHWWVGPGRAGGACGYAVRLVGGG